MNDNAPESVCPLEQMNQKHDAQKESSTSFAIMVVLIILMLANQRELHEWSVVNDGSDG